MFAKLLNLIKTEPQLAANAVQALLGVLVAFGIGLTTDQAGAVLGITAAVLTAVTAASTRPLQVSAFSGLVTAAAVLAVSFGMHLPAGGVASVNLLISAVLALLARGQVTPVAKLNAAKPKPAPGMVPPAPADPVKM